MADLYYFAAWTDSGCLLGCDHKHLTVVSAVVCAQSSSAGSYVVAVEEGELRELTNKEEREFQLAMYGTGVIRGQVRALRPLSLIKPVLN
jgi:hypothetical protein